MLIGLTGTNSSGKSEAANYLREKGFLYFSLSDIVRREVQNMGMPLTRENMIEVGRSLRLRHGPGYLAEQISRELKEPSVVDSIRCPEEVEVLRKKTGFILIGIDAPIELRFRRSRERGRLGDGETLGEFRRLEQEENTEKGQQLQKTLRMSDIIIINDKSIDHLHRQIDLILRHGESFVVKR
ncbi:AAA family ATPase [Candidatus Woesearchaeota archaeon]|nr:AAA family ATPase [Candidatus Woesearchaeota archaeon]